MVVVNEEGQAEPLATEAAAAIIGNGQAIWCPAGALPGDPSCTTSYDSLEGAYGRVMAWMGEKAYRPADVMWESYLNEPTPDAPDANQTLITWPIAD